MKFGKRLAAEGLRKWGEHYLDYKAIKTAIKLDVKLGGALHAFSCSLWMERAALSPV